MKMTVKVAGYKALEEKKVNCIVNMYHQVFRKQKEVVQ